MLGWVYTCWAVASETIKNYVFVSYSPMGLVLARSFGYQSQAIGGPSLHNSHESWGVKYVYKLLPGDTGNL